MRSNIKMRYYFLALLTCCLTTYVHAKLPGESGEVKPGTDKAMTKTGNEKDIILAKNTESTLYLLSGWGKADGPFIWYTISSHFARDQISPKDKPFNLFSASGAVDCKENNAFYYRTSYMFYDSKSSALTEVLSEKNKSNPMPISPGSIESDVKNIICK